MLPFLEYKESEEFFFDSLYKASEIIQDIQGPADRQPHAFNCSFTLRSQIIQRKAELWWSSLLYGPGPRKLRFLTGGGNKQLLP